MLKYHYEGNSYLYLMLDIPMGEVIPIPKGKVLYIPKGKVIPIPMG